MSITTGHFTLTPQQRRFKDMLQDYPALLPFWDFEKRECDVDRLQEALSALSHGEAVMARFFAGIWFGENTFSFDLIDAAKTLDNPHRQVVTDWLCNPEFPEHVSQQATRSGFSIRMVDHAGGH